MRRLRTLIRPRRVRPIVGLALFAFLAAGCSASDVVAPEVALAPGSGGKGGKTPAPSVPLAIPDFVYVSDEIGTDQLYMHSGGVSTRLTFTNVADRQPHVAAGRIVFASWRDGNSEIYISTDLAGNGQTRLTSVSAYDGEPSLSPDGQRVLFVSTRNGGTHRIWSMNADGSDQQLLATGAASYTPERAPRFSPDGGTIAFTSTRSGSSQVWVMPAAGGTPVKLTGEVTGAFQPSWSADGKFIYYTDGAWSSAVKRVELKNGKVTMIASGGASEASCGDKVCLYTVGASGADADVWQTGVSGGSGSVVVSGVGMQRGVAVVR